MTKHQRMLAKFRTRKQQIRALLARGVSQSEVARKFGISRQRVDQLANGK
jgi:transcriptional regulator with XRE-family HTH domain